MCEPFLSLGFGCIGKAGDHQKLDQGDETPLLQQVMRLTPGRRHATYNDCLLTDSSQKYQPCVHLALALPV
jgi:hypothetical protein